MRNSVKLDIEDTVDALEDILKKLSKMSLGEKVDLGARLRGIAKNVDAIDKEIKKDLRAELEPKILAERIQNPEAKDASYKGETFKGTFALNPVNRLDQQALKAEKPKIYEAYLKETEEGRVTFSPR